MNVHKRTRLNLLDRREIWRLYQTGLWKVTLLAEHFRVSRPGIYPRDSTTAALIGTVIAQCPYQVDCTYSDNGTEFKGNAIMLSSWLACTQHQSEVDSHQ